MRCRCTKALKTSMMWTSSMAVAALVSMPNDTFSAQLSYQRQEDEVGGRRQVTRGDNLVNGGSMASMSSAQSRSSLPSGKCGCCAGNGIRFRLCHADLQHLVLHARWRGHQRQLRRLRAQWLVCVLWQFAAAHRAGRALLRRLRLGPGTPPGFQWRQFRGLDGRPVLHGPIRPGPEQLPGRLYPLPRRARTGTAWRRTPPTRTSITGATRPNENWRVRRGDDQFHR